MTKQKRRALFDIITLVLLLVLVILVASLAGGLFENKDTGLIVVMVLGMLGGGALGTPLLSSIVRYRKTK